MRKKNSTSLCIGPLSTNIILAAIEFSNEFNRPLVLVASRRQIESIQLGGGYVNNWSTEELIDFVRKNNGRNILFERDHGGPWQGKYEVQKNLGVAESMMAAKKSFEADVEAGVDIIHIDPTIPVQGEVLTQEIIQGRLFELYGHVSEYSRSKGKKVSIEIGTEEQNGSYTDLQEFNAFLESTTEFCAKNRFEHPLFVVVQTGAKVIENRNVGLFERGNKFDKQHLMKNINDASLIAAKFDIYIKEHNADYLSFENLCLRPQIGIAASNVAPEFGHYETRSLLFFLQNFAVPGDFERFIDIVVKSKSWAKWVHPDSNLKNFDKACLGGHYCYSMPEISEIVSRLRTHMSSRGLDLDKNLRKTIRSSFFRYATAFGLV